MSAAPITDRPCRSCDAYELGNCLVDGKCRDCRGEPRLCVDCHEPLSEENGGDHCGLACPGADDSYRFGEEYLPAIARAR